MSKAVQGILLAFLAYGVFSVADAFIKAVGARLPPFQIVFVLGALSVMALPFLRGPDDPWSSMFRMARPRLVLLRGLAGALAGIFGVVAFIRLPMAEAYAIVFVAPVLSVVLSGLILKETIGWRRVVSVLLGILGVLVVLRPGLREVQFGHLMALCSAVCVSASVLTLRRLGGEERPFVIYAGLAAVTMAVSAPLMLWQGFVWPDPGEWLMLGIAGAAASFAHVALMAATRRAPASLVAPTLYSQMLWAVVYGSLFFGEFPDSMTFAGVALVVASGLVLIARPALAPLPQDAPSA